MHYKGTPVPSLQSSILQSVTETRIRGSDVIMVGQIRWLEDTNPEEKPGEDGSAFSTDSMSLKGSILR